MGSKKQAKTSEPSIGEFIKSREDAHHMKSREDLDSKLTRIQENTVHDPLYHSRPYGLAEDMEGHRVHIWDLIFAHVYDPNTIISLHEVCKMFRDLLERKYKAARLPQVIVKCLERKLIPWRSSRTERSNWVKTLQNLRILSKATRNTVDIQFKRGMLGYESGADTVEWFCVDMSQHHPNYTTQEWKMPTLMLGALDMEQVRLRQILDSQASVDSFPIRALIFNELRPDQLPVDLPELRNVFQECLGKIGWKITSFRYKTNDDCLNAYNNLREWLVHMPNLQELMVDFTSPRHISYLEEADPFPKCPKLKRFAEGVLGFGFPFINGILKANPTIEEVLLGQLPTTQSDFGILSLKQVIKPLNLTKFHCTSALSTPFFDQKFKWSLTLTSFAWLDKRTVVSSPSKEIPSEKIFRFISRFKNLKLLGLMSPCIRYTGGYLNLPKLCAVVWKVTSDFQSLEFLKPAVSLKWLDLDLTSCPHLQSKENVMQFLGEFHIPDLFPALREIDVKTGNGGYKTIWKK